MNCYRWHHWLVVAIRVGVLSMLVMLCACQPEQTPASAARTAAAVRTPAAPPVAQATANAPATLAPASSLATAPPQPRQTPQASPPSLTASPNPLPLGASAMGTTKISWNTGQPVDGQVYVSENGGSETLFSSGPTGSQDAPWIQPDHRYEFRLYMGTTHDQRLATLTIGNPSTEVAASPARKPSVRTDLA